MNELLGTSQSRGGAGFHPGLHLGNLAAGKEDGCSMRGREYFRGLMGKRWEPTLEEDRYSRPEVDN